MTSSPFLAAFPGSVRNGAKALTRQPGMSLRDYFAAQAMIAVPDVRGGADLAPKEYACFAYQLADAMMAAREGGAK